MLEDAQQSGATPTGEAVMVTESEIRNVTLALWIERGRAAGSEPECRAQARRLLDLREAVVSGRTERAAVPLPREAFA